MGDERLDLPKMTARERRVWERLAGFYGALLAQKYGAVMPMAWREDLGRLSDDQIARALAVTRSQYSNFPPNLGQFIEAARPPAKIGRQQRSTTERLTTYAARVLHPRVLTGEIPMRQFSGDWVYVHRQVQDFDDVGNPRQRSECVGVRLPSFQGSPEIYISVEQMELDEATAAA